MEHIERERRDREREGWSSGALKVKGMSYADVC
jgi:hypothetical protein